MIGFSYVFLYSFKCSSHDMFLSIRMIFLRPLGILIGNHLSFNLPSGHAIRFFRLSNIDASWPDIFNNRMSLLKRDRVVNGCLIAQRTCRHNHGLNQGAMILKKLFWTLKFVDSLPKLTLGSIWETLRWPPIPGRNITSVTEFSQQGKKVFFPVFFFFRANEGQKYDQTFISYQEKHHGWDE